MAEAAIGSLRAARAPPVVGARPALPVRVARRAQGRHGASLGALLAVLGARPAARLGEVGRRRGGFLRRVLLRKEPRCSVRLLCEVLRGRRDGRRLLLCRHARLLLPSAHGLPLRGLQTALVGEELLLAAAVAELAVRSLLAALRLPDVGARPAGAAGVLAGALRRQRPIVGQLLLLRVRVWRQLRLELADGPGAVVLLAFHLVVCQIGPDSLGPLVGPGAPRGAAPPLPGGGRPGRLLRRRLLPDDGGGDQHRQGLDRHGYEEYEGAGDRDAVLVDGYAVLESRPPVVALLWRGRPVGPLSVPRRDALLHVRHAPRRLGRRRRRGDIILADARLVAAQEVEGHVAGRRPCCLADAVELLKRLVQEIRGGLKRGGI
mmetsp:Transcript_108640/g.233929  ORF Transcript_108640/g.233929 Transcript_108640/m.233929 type:complete len:376 (+) Transcript_108640:248-1375(+)